MAHKYLRLFGFGKLGPTKKAWDIAHENLEIGRNSSFLAVKHKKLGTVMVGRLLWFLRSYLMARNNFRRSESEGPRPTRKSWAIAHENMGIGQNSRFLAVKRKTNEEWSWRVSGYGSLGRI